MPTRKPTHVVVPPDSVKHANRRAAEQRYDDKRGTAASRGYSSQWQRYAKGFLRQYPWCIACIGCDTSTAVLVDHIVPALQGVEDSGTKDPLFFAPWNHQPLCQMHHARKSRVDAECSEAREYALKLTAGECDSRDLLLRHIRLWGSWVDLSYVTDHHVLRGWSLVK